MKKIFKAIFLVLLLACAWIGGYKVMPMMRAKIAAKIEDMEFEVFCDSLESGCVSSAESLWESIGVPQLWAHAGGGMLGFYTNSREAIEDSIKRGYKVIEIDVGLTSDMVPVLTHNFAPEGVAAFYRLPTSEEFLSQPICGKYTPLSLKNCIDEFSTSDVYFSIDPHLGDFDLISWLDSNLDAVSLRKIIYQIYSKEELIRLAKRNPFGALHFCAGDIMPSLMGGGAELAVLPKC